MCTIPLCTGADADGEANLGVVVAFSSPPAVPVAASVEEPEAGVELVAELLLELLEDAQPAAPSSAAQAISVDRPLLIGGPTLA